MIGEKHPDYTTFIPKWGIELAETQTILMHIGGAFVYTYSSSDYNPYIYSLRATNKDRIKHNFSYIFFFFNI